MYIAVQAAFCFVERELFVKTELYFNVDVIQSGLLVGMRYCETQVIANVVFVRPLMDAHFLTAKISERVRALVDV